MCWYESHVVSWANIFNWNVEIFWLTKPRLCGRVSQEVYSGQRLVWFNVFHRSSLSRECWPASSCYHAATSLPHLVITELSKPGPIPCWPGQAWLGKQQLSKVLIISCHENPSITLMNGILNTRSGEKPSVRSSSTGDKIIYDVSILYTIIMIFNVWDWTGFRCNDLGFIWLLLISYWNFPNIILCWWSSMEPIYKLLLE